MSSGEKGESRAEGASLLSRRKTLREAWRGLSQRCLWLFSWLTTTSVVMFSRLSFSPQNINSLRVGCLSVLPSAPSFIVCLHIKKILILCVKNTCNTRCLLTLVRAKAPTGGPLGSFRVIVNKAAVTFTCRVLCGRVFNSFR